MTPEDALTISQVRLLTIVARAGAGGEVTWLDGLHVTAPLVGRVVLVPWESPRTPAPGPAPDRRRAGDESVL